MAYIMLILLIILYLFDFILFFDLMRAAVVPLSVEAVPLHHATAATPVAVA